MNMCDNSNTYGLPLALVFEEFFKDERDKAAGDKNEEKSTT